MSIPLSSLDSRTHATIEPNRGGAVTHLFCDATQFLWEKPIGDERLRREAPKTREAQSEMAWMDHSTGGWEILAPNAGTAADFQGIEIPFHGLAGRLPWTVDSSDDSSASLSCLMPEPHFRSSRRIELLPDGLCELRETLEYLGHGEHPAIWGSHLAFGGDFIGGPVMLSHNGSIVGGELNGCSDTQEISALLERQAISAPCAGLVFLDFGRKEPVVSLTNLETGGRAVLKWDEAVFPFAWLWIEMQGTEGWPWFGVNRAIGIEPMSSWPAVGLAGAIRYGAPVERFETAQSRTAVIQLQLQGNVYPETREGINAN